MESEYLRLACAVIEERERAVSPHRTTSFHMSGCISLWRKLRKTFKSSPHFPPTSWRMSCNALSHTIGRRSARVYPLNEIPCTLLWRHIRAVYNMMSTICEDHPEIFREFYVLVTRANEIKQQFRSQSDWLQAAVFQGTNQWLLFEELIGDLQICVGSLTAHPDPTATSLAADMESGARTDAVNVRRRIKELLARRGLRRNKRPLVEYLFEREDVDLPVAKGATYPTGTGTPIGRGSSGTVGEVDWLGLVCAKKLCLDEETSIQEECLKEMLILAKVDHPRVVKLLCTSDLPEVSFLMERLPQSLEDWRKEHPIITPAAAMHMMLQISKGIEFLHSEGIVHRDVKSSNVLVTPSPDRKLREQGFADGKLADLGLAKMKGPGLANPTRENIGTTRWRAPEAFAADQPIDWKKADVYSFAMICSEILTGDTPFGSGQRLSELHTRITSYGERPKLPSSCPEALVSLVKSCWDTDPRVRPSFREIKAELTSIKRCMLSGFIEWSTL